MATHSNILAWAIPWTRGAWEDTVQFSPVQLLSHVWLFDPMDCSTPGLLIHHQLLKLSQTHVHWVSDAIQPSHPLSSPFLLPSIFLSIRDFSTESALHIRWPNYWSFSFSISPSSEYSGLNSFRIDWLDLLAVHRALKSLLQHHYSKASILRCSAFFIVQLSHPELPEYHQSWSSHILKTNPTTFFFFFFQFLAVLRGM